MAEERKYRMDRFESRLLRDGQLSLESTKLGAGRDLPEGAMDMVQTVNSGKGVAVGKKIATSLVAAFLLAFGMLGVPATSSARVAIGISVNFGPPALPVYAQPPCPGPGYIWTPGYWAYAPDGGYYWVPGTWVVAPFVGALWTPGYWGFSGGLYLWHPGYWGTRVGFYGGIDYGFGYTGYGYHGGYWRHGRFFYNRAVNRLEGREFRHVYYRRENDNFRRGRRISYHGGPGGISVRPTREQRNAVRFRRFGPVNQQIRHERFARSRPEQRWRVNRGRPKFTSTQRAGEFRGYRGSERGRSDNARRYSAQQQRVERRGFARENRGGQARTNNFQRSQYQARGGGQRGNQGRSGQERHGHAQQQERGHGGNGHGNEHGRGGRR